MFVPRRSTGPTAVFARAGPRYTKDDIVFLKQLVDAGAYRTVIDRRHPIADVVEATTYVEPGQKTGNVVLVVSDR